MNFTAHFKDSLSNLFSAKLRSFLAVLGILVGTASVVALISFGKLATNNALSQLNRLGTHLLAVNLGMMDEQNQNQPQFTLPDLRYLKNVNHHIKNITAYISLFQNISFNGKSYSGEVIGATNNLASIGKISVDKGRFVSLLDGASFYCVIGSQLAHKLNPLNTSVLIGKQIQLGNWLFTIVGITKPWQPNFFLPVDLNNGVVIPISAAYLLGQNANIHDLLMQLKTTVSLSQVQSELQNQMHLLFPNMHAIFRNPEQLVNIMHKQENTFDWLLGSIGGIALFVGGIGVMNIMLVSVIERRREIGIRVAVGAKRKDIRRLFLIESVVLTLFGGLLGIGVGVLVSYILTRFTGWQFAFFITPPILGFSVSVLVGIVSGWYPAWRASKLDPIETLRSE